MRLRAGFLGCLVALSTVASAAPFSRPDQVGQRLMDAGKPADAAASFVSPQHRASALFAAGDTAAAMSAWAEIGDAHSEYNLGTALTQAGDYQAAIDAFDRAAALPDTPSGTDTNRDIAQQLLALAQEQQASSDENDSPQQSDNGADADQQSAGQPEPGEPAASGEQTAEPAEPESTTESEPETNTDTASQEGRESQQAAEQLLSRVPDDPSGLLRARIVREHKRRHGGAGHAVMPW